MKKIMKIEVEKPQYVVTTDITFAQVDSWFGHCRRDLKMDLIYPEDDQGKTYPCIVWICGGAWLRMDKSAHPLCPRMWVQVKQNVQNSLCLPESE